MEYNKMNNTNANIALAWKIYFSFTLCAMLFFNLDAFAAAADASNNAISNVLCSVVAALTGTIGQAIATIGVVVLGVGLFTGKLSWTTALATGLGIGIIFGASNLVTWISTAGGKAAVACTTSS
jgi:type IV secretory pathway VirB2 component (pilin)